MKNSSNIYKVLTIPFCITGIALLLIAFFFNGIFESFFQGSSEKSLVDFGFFRVLFLIMGLGFVVLPFLIDQMVSWFKKNRDGRQSYLLEHGQKGRATLMDITRTGVFVNRVPQFLLELKIEIENGEAYYSSCKKFVDFQYLHLLNEGIQLTVFVNPDYPQNILFNWEEAGIAAAFGTETFPNEASDITVHKP